MIRVRPEQNTTIVYSLLDNLINSLKTFNTYDVMFYLVMLEKETQDTKYTKAKRIMKRNISDSTKISRIFDLL